MLQNMIYRNASNYNFQKCWQIWFPEITKILIFWNVSKPICLEQLATVFNKKIFMAWRRMLTNIVFKILANVTNKCWRDMLTIIFSEMLATNVSNSSFSEMLAIDVSKYNFQKCWRRMLTITMFRNAGDHKYNYRFWRAPQNV